MPDREMYNIHEAQWRLSEATRGERMGKDPRSTRPSWSDALLLRFGESLITLGQRMKELSSVAQTVPATKQADLSQECA